MSTPFNSQSIISHKINETELSTFFVGFDINDDNESVYRIKPLIKKLTQVIHEFAFGFHDGKTTDNTDTLPVLIEAAKSLYKIDSFKDAREIYLNNQNEIEDDIEDKFLRRGEFGELILHLLLRDFHNTIPLLSKIHFKDTRGHAVHGFDSVHIQPDDNSLWLGESKLYQSGKNGVKALVQDIKDHFNTDYLNSEFALISKKIKYFDNIPQKDHWLKLLTQETKLINQLESINIPLLCTYNSELFSNGGIDEASQDFIEAYNNEMRELKAYFDSKNDHPLKSRLNIILILFPVKNKKELVIGLHENLSKIQSLDL